MHTIHFKPIFLSWKRDDVIYSEAIIHPDNKLTVAEMPLGILAKTSLGENGWFQADCAIIVPLPGAQLAHGRHPKSNPV
jgi:hypothetical protein